MIRNTAGDIRSRTTYCNILKYVLKATIVSVYYNTGDTISINDNY